MQFKAEIDQLRTLKKGSKITLVLDEKNTAEMLKNIHNFNNKPLDVKILIDAQEQKERLSRISEDQRKKIYAILKDIASWMGDNVESAKMQLKQSFCQGSQYDLFSLSDCSKELAADFINYLILFAFQSGVELKDHPKDLVDDIEAWAYICLKTRKCCVCGQSAEIHHIDTIGMGRNRKTVDDSDYFKITLCREHHTEAHSIGWTEFKDKYHVVGVIVD